MAKLSRNMLKEVVKECLIEILAEGLVGDGSPAGVNVLESRLNETVAKKPRRSKRKSAAPTSAGFDDAIGRSVRTLTDDDIMASIFEDTARTTLQEQIGAESKGPMDSASQQMDGVDPTELFGEPDQAADHWAQLAFADARPGKDNK
jgi:hypothetical protein